MVSIPSIAVLDRTLRDVTEFLAAELTAPSEKAPGWDDLHWRIALAAAVMQGIAPLLAKQVRWHVPFWVQTLHEQRNHVTRRHVRIEALLKDIDERARRQDLVLVALKGSALHALGVYEPGDRPMADIDLLVRRDDRTAAQEVLRDCGFDLTFINSRHDLFEPRNRQAMSQGYGEHFDNPLKVELHTSIRERLPVDEIDITDLLFPHAPQAGINGYRSTAALMRHLLLHAAGNMRAHALRHIQLCDLARLSQLMGELDWSELLDGGPGHQPLWWAAPPLILTAKYFPRSIPDDVVRALEPHCTWLLRSRAQRQNLSDVSWSNIRIYALPGVEWCKSLTDFFLFVRARILPDEEIRANLKHVDHEVKSSAVAWYGLSQNRRILKWVFSRPPRVQTMSAVRTVLAMRIPPGRQKSHD